MGGTLKSIVCDYSLQEEVDECMSEPCANGATCIDGLASVTCQCAAGFTGLFCDVSSKKLSDLVIALISVMERLVGLGVHSCLFFQMS